MAGKTLFATITGENFQPVRLHYRMLEQCGLMAAFRKLRCIKYDPAGRRWTWLYDHEAKHLAFKVSYGQLPKHLRPIVIGSWFLRNKEQLLLDLRSCERACLAIEFFDQHVPRAVAQVTEAEVVNRLFSTDNPRLTPDGIFDHQPSTLRDPDALVQTIVASVAGLQKHEDKFRVAHEILQADEKKPLPDIERFPVNFYEDGTTAGFVLFLRVRQIVAMQRWLGNAGFTVHDALELLEEGK